MVDKMAAVVRIGAWTDVTVGGLEDPRKSGPGRGARRTRRVVTVGDCGQAGRACQAAFLGRRAFLVGLRLAAAVTPPAARAR